LAEGGRKVTLPELLELWRERDRRYGLPGSGGRPRFVSDAEAESIRAFRDSELSMVPAEDRALAWSALMRWQPPAIGR
jgi:hypothetical protein